eukprot:GHVN01033738.1.p1 GENE.GHVN01033738.1~~GHVN01033738.1.p1  ORF type:complete len:118 (-),score=6.60 GHVN01033738.1:785-1138(-)
MISRFSLGVFVCVAHSALGLTKDEVSSIARFESNPESQPAHIFLRDVVDKGFKPGEKPSNFGRCTIIALFLQSAAYLILMAIRAEAQPKYLVHLNPHSSKERLPLLSSQKSNKKPCQ